MNVGGWRAAGMLPEVLSGFLHLVVQGPQVEKCGRGRRAVAGGFSFFSPLWAEQQGVFIWEQRQQECRNKRKTAR